MRRRLATALVLTLGGCGGSAETSEDAVADVDGAGAEEAEVEASDGPSDEVAGFAVPRLTASFYRNPSTEAVAIPASSLGPEPFAVRVVAVDDAWVHVENLAEDDAKQHCTAPWDAGFSYRLRFWIRKSDLALVTRRPVFAKYDNGTSIMIGAGVQAETLDVEPASLGRSYLPGPRFDEEPQGAISDDVDLSLRDGESLPYVGSFNRGPRGPFVYGMQGVPGGTLVTLGRPCVEVRALAHGRPDLDAIPADTAAGGAMAEGIGERWVVPASTPVSWPDATEAGTLLEETTFTTAPRVQSSLRCWAPPELGFELCFASDAVDHRQPAFGIIGILGAGAAEEEIFGGGAIAGAIGEDEGLGGLGGGSGSAPKKPRVRMGVPRVSGALDKDVVRREIRKHVRAAKTCYEDALADDPSATGKIGISFIVLPDGSLKSVKPIKDSVGDADLSDCVVKAIEGWTFPEPLGGGLATVKVVLDFSPG